MRKLLLLLTVSLFVFSCANVRPISQGKLDYNESYSFYSFSYNNIGMPNKKFFESCKVFITHIQNEKHKVKERIISYSCDSIMPMVFFVTQNAISQKYQVEYLITDTTANFLIPLDENHKQVFAAMNSYFSQKGFPTYDIKGFRIFSKKDSLAYLPMLKTALSFNHK